MREEIFGYDGDTAVREFTLENANGMKVTLISFGARIKDLFVPDGNGDIADVSLGYNDIQGYINDACYLGATIGRVSNRISNACFSLNGKEYKLFNNDGKHHLHGGRIGFDKRHWSGKYVENGVSFTLLSPAGEEGYPGNAHISVTYRLTGDNALCIAYNAHADEDTPLCLTNHCYFNLAGKGDILGHELLLNASRYMPGTEECVPSGEILSVLNTPMDFTSAKTIGSGISENFAQTAQFGGYDHNYVLDGSNAAMVYEPVSKRRMYVETDMPCIQLYTANTTKARGKLDYESHCALCLETQYAPDAVNAPHLSGGILRRGQTFEKTTVYRFEW